MKERIGNIRKLIHQTAINCGRNPAEIRLVGVSKTFPAEIVRQAIEAGMDILGENYIQEAKEKIAALSSYPVSWHFIGHLQSNKAKYAVKLFDLIHTVDSLKLAEELNRQAAKIGKIQDILIEVNVGNEETKSGISVEDALPLIRNIADLTHLSVKGLMTIPPFYDEPEKVRPYFKALWELRDTVRAQSVPGILMNELSMGMSGDFQIAIEEGATMVRIGTAIFGGRV
ncbi:MAG: YggS family pyridoxal phosphate-dependent enzyme [Desulfobacteraceae bacterium]|nr:YggS family pyridoxal phosphate-dependent enzyme [Desulfobacteraceae bacterium]